MVDNTLKITIEQTEGGKVLSKLVLDYPNLPNDQANAVSMDVIDALSGIIRGYAGVKAEATGSPPELVERIKGGKGQR
jgi:hypothetical protein